MFSLSMVLYLDSIPAFFALMQGLRRDMISVPHHLRRMALVSLMIFASRAVSFLSDAFPLSPQNARPRGFSVISCLAFFRRRDQRFVPQ